MKGTFPIDKFRELRTPFYYYDTKVLRDTLSCVRAEAAKYGNFEVHYAVKANANPKVLTIIRENGLCADCVSGGEVRAAVKAGFPTNKIVFAYDGRDYVQLSLSERMRCGLEVVELLSRLIGRNYPLFVDNSESLCDLGAAQHAGQLILTRVVSGQTLQVQAAEPMQQKAG